jgi:hypothetical protein
MLYVDKLELIDSSDTSFYFFASVIGGKTLDQGEGGGNPFASALVELLTRNDLTLDVLTTDLASLTEHKSGGFQQPDLPSVTNLPTWRVIPKLVTELRVALVLVFSDYSLSNEAISLPGAKHDAYRVATALEKAGFETQIAIDPTRQGMDDILRAFAERSAVAEAALLYTTGHGVNVNRTTYLLPGDYPIREGNSGLTSYAIQVSMLGKAMCAKLVNLVFYGGCRDNPFNHI